MTTPPWWSGQYVFSTFTAEQLGMTMTKTPGLEQGLEDPQLLFADGFDDCIAGVVSRFGAPDVVCYDLNKVIANLEAQGMDRQEALEYFEYNMIGAWVGPGTPCYLEPFNREEIEKRLDPPNE